MKHAAPHPQPPTPLRRALRTMNRVTAMFLIGAVLVACFAQVLSSPPQSADSYSSAQDTHPVQPRIDQSKVVPLPAIRAPEDFGTRAMEHVRMLTSFGPRHSGTPGWSRQLDYLQSQLQELGLVAVRDTWTDRKELLTFTNLSVTIPGKRPERILLGAHHDTKCTTGHKDPAHNFHFVGANDGGSGVAVLLEIARVLQRTPPEATLQLVFFDGEESLDWTWNDGARALFGSRRFVKQYREDLIVAPEATPRILAMVLVDLVGRTDLHLQEELYSTSRLRTLQWSAAVALGYQQQVFRRAEAASDDHMPFLEYGIPALDIIDLTGNPFWHTKDDTIDNMSAKSLQTTGDLVLTLLPAIAAEYLPARN